VVAEAREQAWEWLASELPEGGMRRVPLHWPLEFPEVFSARDGFDAIIGNPPFLGGPKVSAAMGGAYRGYLVEHLAHGLGRTNTDLVAYFALRLDHLLRVDGQAGIVATNTLAQGDTREVGLDQLTSSYDIRRAVKSSPWPSKSATLEYCAIWLSGVRPSAKATRVLNNAPLASAITSSLNPESRTKSWVERLEKSKGISFNGVNLIGDGFFVTTDQMAHWKTINPESDSVLFPYLNGQGLNSKPSQSTGRWVINFGEMSEQEARSHPDVFSHLEGTVKAERSAGRPSAYPGLMDRWWQYWRPRGDMFTALAPLDQCIVMALVSKSVMPAVVPAKQVFANTLAVFASDDFGLLALLSSAPHYWWAIETAGTMKQDLRYAPTDVFETLVRPPLTESLRTAGAELEEFRGEIMKARKAGLTDVYNLVHNRDCHDSDIVELRRLHEEIDKATVKSYGWHDLLDETGATPPADPTHETFPLDHGFHETDQGTRYTIGILARTEIIDRLRQLNHQAYADEVFLGLHKKPQKHPDMPSPSAMAYRKKAEQGRKSVVVDFEDDGLFRPEGTIF
jgi:hypothetical protein